MKNFDALFSAYNCNLSDEKVTENVSKIIADNYKVNNNINVYKKLFSLIDLTSLGTTDNEKQIITFTEKVNQLSENFPEMENVAAICVYPCFVETVKNTLIEDIEIAAVAAGFPSSQTFIEIKIAETALAVSQGASEIDIVLSVGKFLSENYDESFEEIEEIKSSCRNSHLKVILETGALATAKNIKKASLLCMEAGADFIKTSTGKTNPAATPEAAYVMCEAIREYYKNTGKKVGFKAAGGISTTEDAVKYYCIVKEILGEEWLNSSLFRLGASRLANNLLTDIYKKEVKYF